MNSNSIVEREVEVELELEGVVTRRIGHRGRLNPPKPSRPIRVELGDLDTPLFAALAQHLAMGTGPINRYFGESKHPQLESTGVHALADGPGGPWWV